MSGISDEQGYTDYAAVALPRLRRIAYLLCQDWHRADDLTQNALTRLYVHWGRARAAEHLDAYVGAILLNVYLAEQRTHWWKRTSVRAQRRQPGGRCPGDGRRARRAPVDELERCDAVLHLWSRQGGHPGCG